MSAARTTTSKARPQGSAAGGPPRSDTATRILAGTATIYLVPGHADYVARAPGDLDVVDVDADHAELLRQGFATEEVPLLESPAWVTAE